MSKFRIMVSAVVDTENHADTLLNMINNRVSGKDIFEIHNVSKGFNVLSNEICLGADIRFNSRIDRDDLKTFIIYEVLNKNPQKNWIIRLNANDHLCSHDDIEVKDCKTTEFLEWVK